MQNYMTNMYEAVKTTYSDNSRNSYLMLSQARNGYNVSSQIPEPSGFKYVVSIGSYKPF